VYDICLNLVPPHAPYKYSKKVGLSSQVAL
jgi:hypothetical protein